MRGSARVACIVVLAAPAALLGLEAAALLGPPAAVFAAGAAPVEVVELGRTPEIVEPAVTFLPQAPVIDGLLDEGLAALPLRRFTTVLMRNAGNPMVPMAYRIAYGTHFFYAFIEVYSGELYFNDRAFQNGDGFNLVIAAPRPGNRPADEFYVLGCSAVDNERMEWTRRIFWYHDIDRLFLPTSDDTRMELARTDSTITFELLLPWSDVYPYHPWLSEGIGFNLCAVKALENGSKNLHFVVLDENIGAEYKRRLYARLRFEEPVLAERLQTHLILDRNNITVGDTLRARAVTLAAGPSEEELRTAVQTREGRNISAGRLSYRCEAGLTYHETTIDSHALPPGGYRVKWYSRVGDSDGEYGLGVLPGFDPAELRRRIEAVRYKVSPASYRTMLFCVEEIQKKIENAGPYETLSGVRSSMTRLFDSVEGAGRGLDDIAEQRNFVRKAYRSEVDGTLQPYVVFVPLEFDPELRYPLLVYLHGSAEDETGIKRNPGIIPGGFIALAPRGRGPSNAFSWGHAQEDIAEAIDAVVESYPIDTGRIVLAGFSMGGYGVYRTHYETPGKYRGLAVFSGHPNLPNRWYGVNTYLNFKKLDNLDRFEGVPIFVFHGARDRNAPLEATEIAIERMRRAGADVEFHIEEEKGHEAPGDETMAAYARWIERILGE